MWTRETCAEIQAVIHRAGIRNFRVSHMDGGVWDVDKKTAMAAVDSSGSRYVLYRVYVEDYKVWLEILNP